MNTALKSFNFRPLISNRYRAVFITNAGPDIGGGHLSRCFALAGALERLGAACSWILNESARRQAESLKISDADYFQKPFETDLSELMEKVDFAVVDS
jgi:spore coat polysaccharide biosynthesis predicted glycosyltransferase SpsG